MIVGIAHNNLILRRDGQAARLGELATNHAEFAEFAVVRHLMTMQRRARWVGVRRDDATGHLSAVVGVSAGNRFVRVEVAHSRPRAADTCSTHTIAGAAAGTVTDSG